MLGTGRGGSCGHVVDGRELKLIVAYQPTRRAWVFACLFI